MQRTELGRKISAQNWFLFAIYVCVSDSLFLPLILHALTLIQCDKMDRLFAQDSVIYSKDDLSNNIKNCKGEIYKGANELKILSNYVETFKISPKQQ